MELVVADLALDLGFGRAVERQHPADHDVQDDADRSDVPAESDSVRGAFDGLRRKVQQRPGVVGVRVHSDVHARDAEVDDLAVSRREGLTFMSSFPFSTRRMFSSLRSLWIKLNSLWQ